MNTYQYQAFYAGKRAYFHGGERPEGPLGEYWDDGFDLAKLENEAAGERFDRGLRDEPELDARGQ